MTDMMTLMADGLLLLGAPGTVAVLFLIGFRYHDQTTWGVAIMLAGFSMMLNPALKEYFALPRPEGLSDGYAFPSGHFQGAMCFYGWLFIRISNKWARLLISLILAGIAFGLVYKGYHYVRDIMGSFVVGSLVITGAYVLLKREPFKSEPGLLGLPLAVTGLIPIGYMYMHSGIQRHSLLGLIAITAVMVIWTRFFPEPKSGR
jgi:membrane-associated phospholipid phosphatase